MTIRFYILQAHYRSTIDFGNEALQAAEKGFKKLISVFETLDTISPSKVSTFDIDGIEKKCYAAINDDFNTPIVIAHLFDGIKMINSTKENKETLTSDDLEKLKTIYNNFVLKILGLQKEQDNKKHEMTDKIMTLLLKIRENAKANKNFMTADLIRDELKKLNIQINDGRKGSSWKSND